MIRGKSMPKKPKRTANRSKPKPPSRTRLAKLQALVLDCDGVLTPGYIYCDAHGTESVQFHSRDGLGLAMLCRSGFLVAILSGRPTDIAERRLSEIGINKFVGRCKNKGEGLIAICAELNILPQACAFMGDDLPDLAAFQKCGCSIAVADAQDVVKTQADWVTEAKGGHGAVREVCTAILKARGEWETALEYYGLGNT